MTIDDLISNKICRNLQHNCTRRAPSVSTNYSFETDRACEENTAFIFYTLTFYPATDKTADSWLHFRGTILPLQHFFFFLCSLARTNPPTTCQHTQNITDLQTPFCVSFSHTRQSIFVNTRVVSNCQSPSLSGKWADNHLCAAFCRPDFLFFLFQTPARKFTFIVNTRERK